MGNSITEKSCRACSGTELKSILSLGETPLANSLVTKKNLGSPEQKYPLELVFCPGCSLVQITETVAPETLFSDYVYFSSFAETTVRNAQELVNRLASSRGYNEKNLAVEIASNDGYLLKHYVNAGVPVLGIEPAKNIAAVANENGVNTLNDFFNSKLARKLKAEGKSADVIHANNVLAHVAGLNDVIEGIGILLKDEGTACIEVPWVKDMVDNVEFDTIYHEHLCYFSLTALDRMFKRHGLHVTDVEHLEIHGGSLRVFVGKRSGPSQSVRDMLQAEDQAGMRQIGYYTTFGERVAQLRADLADLLNKLKDEGKRVVAYGASAKGSTLLNYFKIGKDSMDYVVDRSTVKQGLFTPGTQIPIYPTERLLQDQPDYVLLLTWNFADEILQQQSEYRSRGGQFIIPIPELKVI